MLIFGVHTNLDEVACANRCHNRSRLVIELLQSFRCADHLVRQCVRVDQRRDLRAGTAQHFDNGGDGLYRNRY